MLAVVGYTSGVQHAGRTHLRTIVQQKSAKKAVEK